MIFCDNERAVIRVNELYDTYPQTVREAMEAEHDLLYEINKVKMNIKHDIQVAWVKGHVQHPTSLEETLNIKADRLAKANRDQTAEHRGKLVAEQLPNQSIRVTLGETTYSSHILTEANRHVYGYEAEDYIRKKFNISTKAMNDVDWESCRRLTKSLTLPQRAQRAKFTYRWNYT